jgi:hypothetical protein
MLDQMTLTKALILLPGLMGIRSPWKDIRLRRYWRDKSYQYWKIASLMEMLS